MVAREAHNLETAFESHVRNSILLAYDNILHDWINNSLYSWSIISWFRRR